MANTGKEKYFGDVCIKTSVIPYLEEIADLLSIAFGPMGDAVMIHQKSPKEVKLTKVNETLETAFLTNHNYICIYTWYRTDNFIFFFYKCGLEILNTFKGSRHPVIDLVINSLQVYAKQNGADGVKRIIFMLKFFLRAAVQDNTSNRWSLDG